MPDTTDRVTSLAWAADNKTLFLVTEDPVTKRSDKLWRHMMGTRISRTIYDEKDELYDIGIGKTRDLKFLILQTEAKDTSEVRYLRADHRRTISRCFCRARRSTATTWTIGRGCSISGRKRAAEFRRDDDTR